MSKIVKLNILGIKFKLKIPNKYSYKINGKNNKVEIDERINPNIKIKGNNNEVIVTKNERKEPVNLKINILGNNNKVIIKNISVAYSLYIDIGNYTGVNDCTIIIDDNLVCAGTTIYAYQNNVPIHIGKNCMISTNTVIRSGELPHSVFDKNTYEDFDKSNGIEIGNHVWIGEHAYILKRAKIADNSIVGTMSVVTKRFEEPNVVIAGNPAKICKDNVMWLEDYKDRPEPINV